jgi:monoamine oxidase
MSRLDVVVVGAGLSGLYTCRGLQAAGVSFSVIEARNRPGGRILTEVETGSSTHDAFDLGPSWFWPEVYPPFATLLRELELAAFEQNTDGDVIVERMSREPSQRYRRISDGPRSMRIQGGTGALIRRLTEAMPRESISLNSRLTKMSLCEQGVDLTVSDVQGNTKTISTRHVIAALPPRLLEATVSFTPAIDEAVANRWRNTPTWMAGQAKFFALYDRPFWRESGLSGTAQSMVGPMAEIHDATTASGGAALFGFVGVPANQRAKFGQDAIASACVGQLARIFGPKAGLPLKTLLKDWASDPFTATERDRTPSHYFGSPNAPWVPSAWQDYLFLSGSETSHIEAGFLAGALEAASVAVDRVLRHANVEDRLATP